VIFQDRKIAGDASRRRGPPEGKSHEDSFRGVVNRF
jgi:hypothetical protein